MVCSSFNHVLPPLFFVVRDVLLEYCRFVRGVRLLVEVSIALSTYMVVVVLESLSYSGKVLPLWSKA